MWPSLAFCCVVCLITRVCVCEWVGYVHMKYQIPGPELTGGYGHVTWVLGLKLGSCRSAVLTPHC